MTFQTTPEAIKFISESQFIDYDDSFSLSKYCSQLLRSKEHERDGRDIVIRVRDAWSRLQENTKPIWNDLTEAAGLYPYLDTQNLSTSALLRYEYHKSPFMDDIFLHEEQQYLSVVLQSKKSVVVSAPTSFGKSLLIEEIVASRLYKQIVIIQPTLALLDETRKKLLKYREFYKIIVSTNQSPDEQKNNIFLFTGERVVEYEHFETVDFFVIDEFYKLSLNRDDDRAIALNQAFNRLLKFTNKFYLLGPMIKNIPVSFKEKFDLTWFPTEFSTVAVDEKSLEITGKVKATEKKQQKKAGLFNFLSGLNDQTLIYCSSPNKATTLGIEFIAIQKDNQINLGIDNPAETQDILEWIAQNINPRWSLIDAIKSGVAFHHGALPRHLGSSIVDAFNNGSIRWLFCTSTLIEGVNTSAKNVVLFDKEKGTKQIDFFDYKNIAGRSGRMNKHFIGNVIRFEKQPDQMELFVDIPLFDQENAPLEILIALDDADVVKNVKHKLDAFNNLDEDLKKVLRKNSSINIDGQLNIIALIEANIHQYRYLLNWTAYPTYDQILAVIDLAWNNLLKPGENKADIRSAAHLAVLTIKYSQLKSVSALINDIINDPFYIERYPDQQTRINSMAFFILNIVRHWFDYKLPKWISVISDLQEYVLKKHNIPFGNYSFFASSLEHTFLPPSLAALMEYDIPVSAINKLRRFLNEELSSEVLINQCNNLTDEALKSRGLINYEIKKIRNAF
ncbi:DEAD/DEAH box helicase [Mucilaginibacter sp. OK283]|uniref:DEAD/DEAH box helicase n=1 Tax=Mucilaginibacter sp. OK283 TaxID=1881049 RepID=UPI0008D591B0|nr:DEAD/DEAH box helicase [Mucilaginibacter sp. OK283]SEO14921.1 DEAD/DEAH box helicase [Mucilaginibacter sp. OK283]